MSEVHAEPVKYAGRGYIVECAIAMGFYVALTWARPWMIAHAANHDLALAASYADHVALLEQGRLVVAGAPEQVLTPERLLAVYRWPVRLQRNGNDWQVNAALAQAQKPAALAAGA